MTGLSALLALSLASPGLAQPETPATADLVTAVASVQPGKPFWAALRVRMESGWYIYFRNPGDSGQATRLDLKLPAGWKAEPMQWPAPVRHLSEGLTSFGYEGEVLFPLRLTPPATLKAGSQVTITGEAKWLACSDVCLPGGQSVQVTLPVASRTPDPHPQTANPILRAVSELPRNEPELKPTAQRNGTAITLSVAEARVPAGSRVDFFPHVSAVLDHGQEPVVTRSGGRVHLQLRISEFSSAPATSLEGTLVVTKSDERRLAYLVRVPLAGGR